MDGQTDRQTDGQTDVGHINLIGGLVTRNPPNKAKTQNRLFYDPSLTHKGGSGGKSDLLS